jgi:hypothetical protein
MNTLGSSDIMAANANETPAQANPPLYPSWQSYFRKHQPPMLIAWGKNEQISPAPEPSHTSAI